MSSLFERVATNVRFLRESHGISLAQLAARTGVAKSTLSQLEAGGANPTLATLEAVATALSVDVGELLGESSNDDVTHVRRGTGVDDSGGDSVSELMRSALVGPSILEFHRIQLTAGSQESSPSHGSGSREHVLVLSGPLKLGPLDNQVLADTGDYVAYPGDRIHHFEATGADDAVYWIVATFPRSLSG